MNCVSLTHLSLRPSQEEEEGLDISLHKSTIMYDKQNPLNLHDVPAGYFAAYYYKDLIVIYNNLVWLCGGVVFWPWTRGIPVLALDPGHPGSGLGLGASRFWP